MHFGTVSQAAGSAYIELGATKVLCGVCVAHMRACLRSCAASLRFDAHRRTCFRYGPRESVRAEAFSDEGRLRCDVKLASFARAHARGAFGQARAPPHPLGRRTHAHSHTLTPHATLPPQSAEERELSAALLQALHAAVLRETFPKASVDVYVLILQADGGELAAATMAAAAALAHAGVAMRDLVAACAVVRTHARTAQPCIRSRPNSLCTPTPSNCYHFQRRRWARTCC